MMEEKPLELNEEREPAVEIAVGKRRRWPKVLLGLAVCLVGFLLWLNGPGWRWVAGQALVRLVPKLGMNVQADFVGSLSSGEILLKNVHWKALTGGGEARVKELAVRYDPREVTRGRLLGVRLEGVDGKVDLEGDFWKLFAKKKPEGVVVRKKSWREQVAELREKLLPMVMDVRDVNAEIFRGKDLLVRVKGLRVGHEGGAEEWVLGYDGLGSDVLKQELAGQAVHLSWGEKGVEVKELVIFPDLRLRDIAVVHTPGLGVKGELLAFGGEFFVQANELQAELRLMKGMVKSREVGKWLAKPLPEEGELSALWLKGVRVGDEVKVDLEELRWKGEKFAKRVELKGLKLEGNQVRLREGEIRSLSLGGGVVGLDLAGLPKRSEKTPATTGEKASQLEGIAISPERSTKEITAKIQDSLQGVLKSLGVARERVLPLELDVGGVAVDVRRGEEVVFVTPEVSLQHEKGADAWRISLAEMDLGRVGKAAGQKVEMQWGGRAVALGRVEVTRDLVVRDLRLDWGGEEPKLWVNVEAFGTKSLLDVSASRGELKLLEGELTSEKLAVFLPENLRAKGRLSELRVMWQTKVDDFGEGRVEVSALRGTLPGSGLPFSVQTRADFALPGEVRDAQLRVSWGGDLVELEGGLGKEYVRLRRLVWSDAQGEKLQGVAEIPVGRNLLDWKGILLREKRPMRVRLELLEQPLTRLVGGNAVLTEKARAKAFFALTGSPSQPEVAGEFLLSGVELKGRSELKSSDVRCVFQSKSREFLMDVRVENPQQVPVSARVRFPWKTREWVERPEQISRENLQGDVRVAEVDLGKFRELVPQLAKLEGKFEADVKFSGPVRQIKPVGMVRLRGGLLQLKSSQFPAFEKVECLVRADEKECRLQQASFVQAGGTLNASGVLRWQGYQPRDLDVRLRAEALPLMRNDSLILRTNGDLRLSGPWAQATLAGRVSLVDGIFYRDVELIPIGAPFRQPAQPKMPRLQTAKSKQVIGGLPKPFGDWRLALKVDTENDFLIRGNFARGDIGVDLAVGGTFANPEPRGEAKLKELVARLPFSTLRIRNGSLKFRSDAPFDPILDVRGKSVVRPYDLDVFAYGPVSNVKILFNSNPPLPENEIMTLIATGTTSKGLEDSRAAMSRGVQLLIEEARRGRIRYARRLMPLLNLAQNVDFQVGGENQYTGQRFNSATLRLHRHWQLSAGIGEEGNSRFSVIYLLQR